MRLVLTCRGSGAAVSAGPGRAPRSARGDVKGGALKQVREARITGCSEVGSESVQRADKEAHDPKQVVQYDARDAGWYGSDAMRLAGLAGVGAGDGGIHARTSLSGNGLRAGKGVVGAGAAKPPRAVRAGTAFRGRVVTGDFAGNVSSSRTSNAARGRSRPCPVSRFVGLAGRLRGEWAPPCGKRGTGVVARTSSYWGRRVVMRRAVRR